MIAAPPILFRCEIETPQPLRAEGGHLRLTGWCACNGQPIAPAVRLVSGTQTFVTTSTVLREDVVVALGFEKSSAQCGFVIEGNFTPGAHKVRLEASCGESSWQLLRELVIIATPAKLQASVEWPVASTIKESVRVQGWCVHPNFEIIEIWLHYGNRRIRCDYGLPRTDVPVLFPQAPNAANAGFIAEKNLPVGYGPLRIRAVTSDGQSIFAHLPVTMDIVRDEENPEPLELHGKFPDLGPSRRPTSTPPVISQDNRAAHRVLFVLYGDFTSNSALHVSNLANALISLGQKCVVAVPSNPETIRYHPNARFHSVSFDDYLQNPAVFLNGSTADIVHAWTTRENVRNFCERIRAVSSSQLVIHLEDHELRILEDNLGLSLERLLALPPAELDALVPATLSHPLHSRTFLQSADAVTLIIDRLRDMVPEEKSTHVIWPAADESSFFPRPIPWDMRRALDWGEDHTVLFYHGNVHAANQAEVRALYLAVVQLNEAGIPVKLIRTGRDFGDFLGELALRVAPHVISLGQIDHQHHLPPLMALADFFVQPGESDAFNDYRFPSKLPEFFALGRPVILPLTNLGKILRHGQDAWILPKADASGIAEAVRTLRDNPQLRATLITGSASVVANYFNWQRSAEKLLAFYNALPSPA